MPLLGGLAGDRFLLWQKRTSAVQYNESRLFRKASPTPKSMSETSSSHTIVSFVNLKGGCGKSTSAVHLCRYLLDRDKTVCLVDADAQQTSSQWIANLEEGIPRPAIEREIEYDPLLDKVPALAEQYDTVVVDGAGGIEEAQRAILLFADTVLVPVQATPADLSSATQTIAAIRRARQFRRTELKAYTFLTRTAKTALRSEAKKFLSEVKDIPLLSAEIPQRQAAADAMGQGKTVFDYPAGDKGARAIADAYRQLFNEMANGSI